MAHMTQRKCGWCKASFQARTADVNRGWAKFCGKACKAKEQEKRTGQNQAFLTGDATARRGTGFPKGMQEWEKLEVMHERAMDGVSDSDYGASDGGG